MQSHAVDFEKQLELFRTEAESAVQFFFAWDAVHTVAASDRSVVRLLDESPLFWSTNLSALQYSAFIALGRVFDPDTSNYSVSRLLALAHANLEIFSKEALAKRKRQLSADADKWLEPYLAEVYVPTGEDFRSLKRKVAHWRRRYEFA
jgi:hypothetical protein